MDKLSFPIFREFRFGYTTQSSSYHQFDKPFQITSPSREKEKWDSVLSTFMNAVQRTLILRSSNVRRQKEDQVLSHCGRIFQADRHGVQRYSDVFQRFCRRN